MNCKEFESVSREIARRRGADKAMQAEALEHAGHCLWCAMRLDEESRLTASLRAFARSLDGLGPPGRVEEALVRAYHRTAFSAAEPAVALARKRLWGRLSWGMTCAATLAAAWLVVLRAPPRHQGSNAPPSRAATDARLESHGPSQAKEGRPWAPAPSGQQVNARSAGARANSPRRSQRTALNASAGEVMTGFIPLGTCDDPECMDEATLVRVTLPAEALQMFGLPMNNDNPEAPVEADVILGSDGVPSAIRFVI
jgi:hypothetical protein